MKKQSTIIIIAIAIVVAMILFIHFQNNKKSKKVKQLETELSVIKGQKEVLNSQLVSLHELQRESYVRDSINYIVIRELKNKLNENQKQKDESLKRIDFYTDAELQRFFAERYK